MVLWRVNGIRASGRSCFGGFRVEGVRLLAVWRVSVFFRANFC